MTMTASRSEIEEAAIESAARLAECLINDLTPAAQATIAAAVDQGGELAVEVVLTPRPRISVTLTQAGHTIPIGHLSFSGEPQPAAASPIH